MQTIIRFEDVSYSIPYGETILEKVELEISAGEYVGVLGHNGAGKTTLMDLLMGFRKASTGSLTVFNEDPHAIARSHRKSVVFLSQDVGIKGSLTIRQFLDFHAGFYPDYSKAEEEHLLKVFKLDPEHKVGSLSTGQQKKVQVVAAFATCPKLILIDEITAVMDPETRKIFFRELERIRKTYASSILLATNIAEDLVERCEKIIFIREKKSTIHSPDEIARLFNLHQEIA
jgi:ABC-2 type transport system ATP-binding protein